ncbi:MAG: tetratricopeptide repeat protein, partial [Candidatus Tectomicrobia bacterium]|nr:tetratricopeptide repeat protein [Candidatus Tectomicrobia bacterium]
MHAVELCDMSGITQKSAWGFLALWCLLGWPLHVEAQKTAWEKYQRTGVQAYKQGRYAEAEKQLTAALEEAERSGLSDQRLSIPLTTLALVYSAQNHVDKAEPLYQRILALRERSLGPEHLEVAAALDNLAEVYEVQGQYLQAQTLYWRALQIREKMLRPTHPGIASSLDNLASVYEAQSLFAEAEPLYQRALQ